MPVLQRASYIAALTETTIGTVNAPTASNGIIVYEADLQPLTESTSTERKGIYGHMGQETPVPGLLRGTFKCKTFLVGSGVDPAGTPTAPPYAPLLIGCGFQQDVTAATNVVFKPASASNAAAWSKTTDFAGWDTLSIFEFAKTAASGATGHVYKLRGAAGNVKISGKVGEPVTLDFDFKGAYVVPIDDQTISTPTFANSGITPQPFINVGATFTPSGGAACTSIVRSFEFDMGCNVVARPDANDTSGTISYVIADRSPKFKMVIEDPDDYDAGATGQDWWTNFTAGTYGVLEFGTVGSTAGNKWAINMPNVGFAKVSSKFEDGIRVLEIDGICATSTLTTGDDEITITFT